ncbi:MAG: response regulator [Cyanobacteria bacterium P01_D01_bin.56]
MRLLLIDDDEVLLGTLMERLIKQRYAVDVATDGATAQDFLELFTYDVIILDMLLPDIDGISLCQNLRQRNVTCPIMMLTARDDSRDTVRALDAGADDYVVKPVDFDELCARVRALLRRDTQEASATLRWGDLSITPETFEVFYGDHQLHMTPKEYALLELLVRHPNRVFSLDAIIENLWVFEDPPSGDAVRTHIKGVRQKLKAGGAPKNFIETVYGLGYRLRAIDTEVSKEPSDPTAADMAAAMAKAWATHRDTMQERLKVLQATAAALESDQLSPELRHAGHAQAHKLAGSLGCFGFAEGSRLARELETLLHVDGTLNHQQGSRITSLVERLSHNLDQESCNIPSASIPRIMLLGATADFGETLTSLGINAGLDIRVLNPSQTKKKIQAQAPDGLVMWLPVDEPARSGALSLLDQLAKGERNIPLLVISDVADFRQRLVWVQQGVDRILPTSTTAQQIIQDLKQLLQANRSNFKVMIVDDDIQVLDFLKITLTPWGVQLFTLSESTQLLQQLEIVQPDVLVLDVEMPDANGLELCQVLRADDRWQQLPVLFLTVHEDMETKKDAFKVGANDFIHKSMMVTDLPLRILSYLQHMRS